MTAHAQKILKEALDLSASERVYLADRLLTSLDFQDAAIDSVWKKEIGDRLRAYKTGEAETISVEEVLAIYQSK
ncbi:MAG: addiction module protein [Chitinivibrionales bacterium]|nr:addiction module protein [Chitinivibrionales bacterium]